MTSARAVPFLTRVSHVFETLAVYIIYGFFRLLPLDAASGTGGALMRCIGPHLGISRVALRNLDRAFPEKTAVEKQKILKGMWDNLGRVAAEYPHLRRMASRAEFSGGEIVPQLKGKPAIFVSAHLANWEVCPVKGRAEGLPVHVVYRKPNNPWVDGLLQRARGAGVVGQISKGASSAREILSVLKRGGGIGMLLDQKMNEGIPVPFFGHDAMTAPALALFALRRGYPLHPMRVERLGGAHFRVSLYPALDIAATGDEEADTRRIMVQVNKIIEAWVRENPAQWLWIHRRWPDSK